MNAIIGILIVLAAAAFAASGYFSYHHNDDLTRKFFIAGLVLSALAILLYLLEIIRKAFDRYFVRRPKQKVISDFIKSFTVRFDKQTHEPHCPVCLTELVPVYSHPSTGFPTASHFKCIPCNHTYCLTNEETGEPLTLSEAKKSLSSDGPSPSPDFQPNEIEVKILVLITRGICHLNLIAQALRLHPIEVELRLTELEKQHYIHCARMLNDNPYSLLDKGKEYVVKNNLLNKELKSKEAEAKIKLPAAPLVADKPADNQTKLGNFIESLQALREHLPEGDIEEKFVDIYHKTTIAIQMGTALNLSQFFIPQKELERRIESFPTGPNIPRHPRAEVEYSKERYCDRAIFLLALDLAINHLKQELRPKEPVAEPEPPTPPPVDLDKSVNAIPFPSPFSPDETQKQILILLAHPYCSPLAHDLAQDLNLSVVRTQNHLDKLKEHGYVTANQFNEQFEPMYRLTRKAREFLVENNLVD